MAVLRRRPGDIDLTQRFDMTGLPERKPKKERQDLKDIWKALGGLPAIRVTPEMIIDLVEQRLAGFDPVSAEHQELKELCWSAFEMEPETIKSLKDWLIKHDS